ncbi:multicopper oxidase-domain-containing protein [Calycina marina]|uniref:Multicopper oxidase-domain-containing protein n=1 Tax=Calycina marina TaxID=1763456 RepID=A0A9P8CF83_9HELO|nr:multicopper oxidase-domain-containing protein [Calycina marina]
MHVLQTLFQLAFGSIVAARGLQVHDSSFVPDAVLVITEGAPKQPCVPAKNILLVNGTSPGPELRFKEGQTIWIRVHNDVHNQNLTIHWHGLTQAAAPFSDGTPAASQWPIPPNHYFDYELAVPQGVAGTYFYHSHVGLQAISCTGPLVIEDYRHPPYRYDDEKHIFLTEVFPNTEEEIEEALLAVPMAYEKDQSMILINGKAGGTDNGVLCNESLPVINVQRGKKYRFRIIAGTGLSFDIFAIEGHDGFDVIEADGAYTEKLHTSFMQVAPGQRFSVLFQALHNPAKNYYYLQLENREFGDVTRTYAIINYGDPAPGLFEPTPNPPPPKSSITEFYPPSTPPLVLPPMDYHFLEYQLRPYRKGKHLAKSERMPTAKEVTRRVNITVQLTGPPDGEFVYLENNYTWNEDFPKKPYLVTLYENDVSQFPSMERAIANDGLDPVTRTYPMQIGEVIEVVIQNSGSTGGGMESHPWHFHGAHVFDMGAGDGIYDCNANEKKWAAQKGKPVKRDTVMLYRYEHPQVPTGHLAGWRTVRLRITEPGVWMVHCHILPHMIWGMQTVFVMGSYSDVITADRPDVEGYLNYGGSVMGNATHEPEVVSFFTAWADNQK